MSLCLVFVLAFAPAVALKQPVPQEQLPPPALPEGVTETLEQVFSALAPPPPMFHIIPKNGFLCMEGTQDYLQNEVLVRLQKSNMQTGWMTSKVEEGTCDSASYWEGPNPDECFPESTRWMDMKHIHEAEAMEMSFVKEYNAQHPELIRKAEHAVVDCMAAPMFHMFPKNSTWCYEGTRDDLLASLKRLKKSNMQTGWQTSFPVPGACTSGSHVTGPYTDDCWPKLSIWMDMKGNQKLSDNDAFNHMVGMDLDYVHEYNAQRPTEPNATEPEVDCLGEGWVTAHQHEQKGVDIEGVGNPGDIYGRGWHNITRDTQPDIFHDHWAR